MAVGITGGNLQAASILNLALTPALVAASTSVEQTFPVSGVRPGDFVKSAAPGVVAGIAVAQARVSARDTVAITFTNSTAGALTPPAGLYQFLVMRPETGNVTSFSP